MSDERVQPPRGGVAGATAARTSPEVYRRRRLVVGVGALVLVLLLVLLAGFVWPGFWRAEAAPQPAPTVTVTAPAPTPTVKAVKRAQDETAFQKALPSAVLQYALGSIERAKAPKEEEGALEAWTATYTDGGSGEVELVAGQWSTSDEAATAATAWTESAGKAEREGDVKVGKKVVGQYAVAPSKGGKAVIVWQNGTAVLRATGPADAVEDFYAAYPL